jgi:hypothetical protein
MTGGGEVPLDFGQYVGAHMQGNCTHALTG